MDGDVAGGNDAGQSFGKVAHGDFLAGTNVDGPSDGIIAADKVVEHSGGVLNVEEVSGNAAVAEDDGGQAIEESDDGTGYHFTGVALVMGTRTVVVEDAEDGDGKTIGFKEGLCVVFAGEFGGAVDGGWGSEACFANGEGICFAVNLGGGDVEEAADSAGFGSLKYS